MTFSSYESFAHYFGSELLSEVDFSVACVRCSEELLDEVLQRPEQELLVLKDLTEFLWHLLKKASSAYLRKRSASRDIRIRKPHSIEQLEKQAER